MLDLEDPAQCPAPGEKCGYRIKRIEDRMQRRYLSLPTGHLWLIACLLCGTVLPSTALARDIFVNNITGPVTTAEWARCRPAWGATWQDRPHDCQGHAAGRAGDRIVLAATDEPYRESVSFVGLRMGGSRSSRSS